MEAISRVTGISPALVRAAATAVGDPSPDSVLAALGVVAKNRPAILAALHQVTAPSTQEVVVVRFPINKRLLLVRTQAGDVIRVAVKKRASIRIGQRLTIRSRAGALPEVVR